MSNEIEKESFNPKFLKIKDYKTVEEYKNDFFVKNIVDTTEYYELAILNSYFIYPFLSLKAISQAYSELYKSDKSIPSSPIHKKNVLISKDVNIRGTTLVLTVLVSPLLKVNACITNRLSISSLASS